MGLSYDLISQFAKVVNKDKKESTESTIYGHIQEDGAGNKYVRVDGSNQLIPLADSLATATVGKDDRVSVLIKDHTATVTGNLSNPATNNSEVADQINKFNTIIVDQVNANSAFIEGLQADFAEFGDVEAASAKIKELDANKASIEQLNDASKTATNFLNFDSTWGLEVGNRIGGAWSGFRAQIRNAAFNILAESGVVIASYGAKLIELGRNATDAVIKLCGGKGTIEYVTDDDTSDEYLQISADKIRMKSSEKSSVYSMYTDESTRWEKSAVNVSPTEVDIYASQCTDPTMVEKVEGWTTSKINVRPRYIDVYTDSMDINSDNIHINGSSLTDDNGTFVSVNEGTSGIWKYKKYSNGDAELWGTFSVFNVACNTAMGSMYRTAVFNPGSFPFTVYEPNVTASYESYGYGAFLWATTAATTAKLPSYYLVRVTSGTINTGKINFHVYGKWKQ